MSLARYAGESLESYITRGSVYRAQLLGLDATLEMGESFYVGHLLDHARLSRRDKVLVRRLSNRSIRAEHCWRQWRRVAGTTWWARWPRTGRRGGRAALAAAVLRERPDEDEETVIQEDDFGEESLEEDLPFERGGKRSSAWPRSRSSGNTTRSVTRLRRGRKHWPARSRTQPATTVARSDTGVESVLIQKLNKCSWRQLRAGEGQGPERRHLRWQP